MNNYFSSKVYNDNKRGEKSTFSILSESNNFSINDAVTFANDMKIKYIFIILAGQQFPSTRSDATADEIYCRSLTGGDRIGVSGNDEGIWRGKYKIHTSLKPKYESTASLLYEKYKDSALVIDVLNTKYNWALDANLKQKVINYLDKTIYNDIYQKIENDLQFFICGFSRGGVLSLKFAKLLLTKENFTKDKISAVVTIDPVINPGPEEGLVKDENGFAFIKLIDKKWYFSSKRPPKTYDKFFPILKSIDGIPYYNVFQRKALVNDQLDTPLQLPIGSCVDNAISPIECNFGNWKNSYKPDSDYKIPNDLKKYVYQNDPEIEKHTPDMLNKYYKWIVDIAENRCII